MFDCIRLCNSQQTTNMDVVINGSKVSVVVVCTTVLAVVFWYLNRNENQLSLPGGAMITT